MKKILIVEDEKMLAEMYVDRFQQGGFETTLARDAESAIQLIKDGKPDLILLDILLPEADGITLLQQIRKDPEIASIPVVAFSNFDNTEAKEQAQKLGVKGYLLKTNYTPQEIVEKVKKYM